MRISDWSSDVCSSDLSMVVRGQAIRLLAERDATKLPWKELGVDVVLECTGKFKKRALIEQHLQAGAGRVFASHPLDGGDLTVVRSEEHTSELQSLMRISYAVFCLKKQTRNTHQ